MLFYAFESSLLPWECTDHENVTINILNWFLFDRFFMLYDSIFFTWFAKRFWVHPFYIDAMPYIVNIIKRCYGILFTAFTCNAWKHSCPFITFTVTSYYSLFFAS